MNRARLIVWSMRWVARLQPIFCGTLGVELDEDTPKVSEAGETNITGLFLLGDISVSKTGGSIITAFNSACPLNPAHP